MVHTQAATAAAAWGATATRWRDQLSTTAGGIITFAVRRVLLLVILYTMELPVIKPALATTRLHLRMGFYGGKDSQGQTWVLGAESRLRRR